MEEICSTPGCTAPQTEGRRFCTECAANLDRIRQEMTEDPLLLYNQRSGNPNRRITDPGVKKKRPPRAPTCCFVGCYELRIPGRAYCDLHEDQVEEHD